LRLIKTVNFSNKDTEKSQFFLRAVCSGLVISIIGFFPLKLSTLCAFPFRTQLLEKIARTFVGEPMKHVRSDSWNKPEQDTLKPKTELPKKDQNT